MPFCKDTKFLIKPPIDLDKQKKCSSNNEYIQCPLIKDDFLDTIYPNVKTCLDVIYNGCNLSNDGDCLGYKNEIEKKFVWISYEKIVKRMKAFGAGLIKIGCKASNFTKICIYSLNRIEWTIAEYGCYHYSMVVVPLYESLSLKSRIFIFTECKPECIIVDNLQRVKILLENIKETPSIKTIIVMEGQITNQIELEASKYFITLFSFSDLEKLGENNPHSISPPKSGSLAMILYTSGTTGSPKGAMLTHSNFVASASGLCMHVSKNIDINKLTFLSFLPMAHSFEQCVQTALFMNGARIGFYSGNIKNLQLDMKLLKPSALILVPLLLNRIYNSIMTTVRKNNFKFILMRKSLHSKKKQIKKFIYNKETCLNSLVFRKLKNKFGGNLKLLASGSAPLSPAVLDFFRCSLDCIVIEGYGQTECCGAATVTLPGDYNTRHVGIPTCCCRIKLIDVPEMNYFVKKNKIGEVCVQGSNVFVGYYMNREETSKILDSHGWLHTGDIGYLNENGTLCIIDRKKHLFKLAQGEYIAPEKIETVYLQSSFVSQCFVDGDSFQNYLIAIVVPDANQMKLWLEERSIRLTSKELCNNLQFKNDVLKDMTLVGQREGLNSLEQVKKIHLTNELFTIENNLITSTLKIKRNECRKHFQSIIKNLYKQ